MYMHAVKSSEWAPLRRVHCPPRAVGMCDKCRGASSGELYGDEISSKKRSHRPNGVARLDTYSGSAEDYKGQGDIGEIVRA